MTTESETSRLFSSEQWDRILGHLGFGNPDAPLWFIGMEEGLGSRPPEVALRNILALQERLDADGLRFSFFEDSWFPAKSKIATQTWKIMAKYARMLLHRAPDWQDSSSADSYIRDSLGRPDGETLLLELLPLPAPHMADWPDAYTERFQNREDYGQFMRSKRIEILRDLVEKYRPTIVMCYGRSYWQYYRQIFALEGAPEDTVGQRTKAIVTQGEGTIVALTPFFGYRYFPQMAIGEVGAKILARQASAIGA